MATPPVGCSVSKPFNAYPPTRSEASSLHAARRQARQDVPGHPRLLAFGRRLIRGEAVVGHGVNAIQWRCRPALATTDLLARVMRHRRQDVLAHLLVVELLIRRSSARSVPNQAFE